VVLHLDHQELHHDFNNINQEREAFLETTLLRLDLATRPPAMAKRK